MTSDIDQRKRALRATARADVAQLDDDHIRNASAQIVEHLLAHPLIANDARPVLAFWPMERSDGSCEPDIMPVVENLARESRLALPRVDWTTGSMSAHSVRSTTTDVAQGRFGLREPNTSCPPIDSENFALILVPGIAFDADGHRLGTGGGFYDRFLRQRTTTTHRCGVVFECQVVDEVPTSADDVGVETLVTERGPRACTRIDRQSDSDQ